MTNLENQYVEKLKELILIYKQYTDYESPYKAMVETEIILLESELAEEDETDK
jgi:hypothetical protein